MQTHLIYSIIFLFVIAMVFTYIYVQNNKLKENFSKVLGTLEPQRRFLEKCIDDCARNHLKEFGTTFSWTDMICQQKCEENAELRRKVEMPPGIPDLTANQFQRHFKEIKNANEEVYLEDADTLYCMKEIEKYCDMECFYSKHPEKCKRDCVKVDHYKCTSGLSWSYKP